MIPKDSANFSVYYAEGPLWSKVHMNKSAKSDAQLVPFECRQFVETNFCPTLQKVCQCHFFSVISYSYYFYHSDTFKIRDVPT